MNSPSASACGASSEDSVNLPVRRGASSLTSGRSPSRRVAAPSFAAARPHPAPCDGTASGCGVRKGAADCARISGYVAAGAGSAPTKRSAAAPPRSVRLDAPEFVGSLRSAGVATHRRARGPRPHLSAAERRRRSALSAAQASAAQNSRLVERRIDRPAPRAFVALDPMPRRLPPARGDRLERDEDGSSRPRRAR